MTPPTESAAILQLRERELVDLLSSLRPNYGDVGSRDVDVTAKRSQIDRAIELLSKPVPGPVLKWQERIVDGAFISGDPDQCLMPTGASAALAARDAEIADLRAAVAALASDRNSILEEVARLCETAELCFDISVVMNSTKKGMTAETARALASLIRALKSAANVIPQSAVPQGYKLVPESNDADEIVTRLYRRFKEWSKRGFGPDDVTWCEVKADVLAMLAAAPTVAQPAVQDAPDEQHFAAWLEREMPAGTVIGDPKWWVPRILRAVVCHSALRAEPAFSEDAAGCIRFRFFKHLSESQRLDFFRAVLNLSDAAAAEVRTHAVEIMLLKRIFKAYTAAPAGEVVAPDLTTLRNMADEDLAKSAEALERAGFPHAAQIYRDAIRPAPQAPATGEKQ